MNRNNSHWILLLLTLTVSAALMHEVIAHDNTTCTVCVQFHGSTPAIDNPDNGFVIADSSPNAILPVTYSNAFFARSLYKDFIRGPPSFLI